MTGAQRINVRADELADKALIAAIAQNKFIDSVFPRESIVIQIAGGRVSGSPKDAISKLWGKQAAVELFDLLGRDGKGNTLIPSDVPHMDNETRVTF